MRETLDAQAVRRWCRLAADALGTARAEIDALNVFPVPDADTGTNLHLTMLSAADAIAEPVEDLSDVWPRLIHGALLGARGNSGVIVSQALRGLGEILQEADDLARALGNAARLARQSVSRPVDGTILTVLDAAATAAESAAKAAEQAGGKAVEQAGWKAAEQAGGKAAEQAGGKAVEQVAGKAGAVPAAQDIVAEAARAGRTALHETMDQLEVLRQNGVVDAGAAGMVIILESLAAVLSGEYPDHYDVPPATFPAQPTKERPDQGPAYEVMYLLDAGDVTGLRRDLDAMGDSLVIVGGDDLWNVHVHVDEAGPAIEAGLAAGRPHRIRVTYLHAPTKGRRARGVVAVAAGAGLAGLFEQSGAQVVRRAPGQSPPLHEILDAIRGAGDEVIVLPNDNGVRAVASSAAQIAREEGIAVNVLPTKSSVQGLAALAVHDPSRRLDDDVVAMTDAAAHTRSGHIWVADRSVFTSAGVCEPGDVIGVIDGDVAMITDSRERAACQALDRMLSGGEELVTILTGIDATPQLAQAVQEHVERTRPDVEVCVYEGGQGGYPLLFGVE